eukprot:gnl/TRDRNA2_/TRDRNA2_166795_c1_seq3.p1 gnl/TRDRNA2_/TRDRNA2_166795_c1~~gnl/TRDRNA2_/TRDRNA2_166795_c1_seq3.p1  ORF type:complete len:412 (+),score=74.01 gnl/TRDRNA2_/TRDRNA2_166795_c1_seq3:169-1404(+)
MCAEQAKHEIRQRLEAQRAEARAAARHKSREITQKQAQEIEKQRTDAAAMEIQQGTVRDPRTRAEQALSLQREAEARRRSRETTWKTMAEETEQQWKGTTATKTQAMIDRTRKAMIQAKRAAATTPQQAAELEAQRRQKAVLKIQCMYRTWKARTEVQMRRQERAAIKIQGMHRTRHAKIEVHNMASRRLQGERYEAQKHIWEQHENETRSPTYSDAKSRSVDEGNAFWVSPLLQHMPKTGLIGTGSVHSGASDTSYEEIERQRRVAAANEIQGMYRVLEERRRSEAQRTEAEAEERRRSKIAWNKFAEIEALIEKRRREAVDTKIQGMSRARKTSMDAMSVHARQRSREIACENAEEIEKQPRDAAAMQIQGQLASCSQNPNQLSDLAILGTHDAEVCIAFEKRGWMLKA